MPENKTVFIKIRFLDDINELNAVKMYIFPCIESEIS